MPWLFCCEAPAEHPLIESLHFPDDMEQITRGQEGSNDPDVSQVMSGQVAANSAGAPLSAVVEGASTTTSATREISNLMTSGAASTAEGGSAVMGVALPMALTADVAVGLPVQVERPRALLEEEQRLSVEVGRAPLEQRSRLSISVGDGVANTASQALEEACSGVTGEASLRQDTSGLGAKKHAGATGGQIGDAAYVTAGSAPERVDAGIRSAFATPRSSQPTLRSFSGLGLGPTSQGEACMSASQLQDMGAAFLPKVRDIDVDNAGMKVDVLLQGWTERTLQSWMSKPNLA